MPLTGVSVYRGELGLRVQLRASCGLWSREISRPVPPGGWVKVALFAQLCNMQAAHGTTQQCHCLIDDLRSGRWAIFVDEAEAAFDALREEEAS